MISRTDSSCLSLRAVLLMLTKQVSDRTSEYKKCYKLCDNSVRVFSGKPSFVSDSAYRWDYANRSNVLSGLAMKLTICLIYHYMLTIVTKPVIVANVTSIVKWLSSKQTQYYGSQVYGLVSVIPTTRPGMAKVSDSRGSSYKDWVSSLGGLAIRK